MRRSIAMCPAFNDDGPVTGSPLDPKILRGKRGKDSRPIRWYFLQDSSCGRVEATIKENMGITIAHDSQPIGEGSGCWYNYRHLCVFPPKLKDVVLAEDDMLHAAAFGRGPENKEREIEEISLEGAADYVAYVSCNKSGDYINCGLTGELASKIPDHVYLTALGGWGLRANPRGEVIKAMADLFGAGDWPYGLQDKNGQCVSNLNWEIERVSPGRFEVLFSDVSLNWKGEPDKNGEVRLCCIKNGKDNMVVPSNAGAASLYDIPANAGEVVLWDALIVSSNTWYLKNQLRRIAPSLFKVEYDDDEGGWTIVSSKTRGGIKIVIDKTSIVSSIKNLAEMKQSAFSDAEELYRLLV